jgi:hypothetical protein
MCNACEFPASSGHWAEAGLATEPADAARDRLAMLAALGAALAVHGLRVRAPTSWSGFQILTPSGRFENARNLDEAWAAVEKMLGGAVDPLSPLFKA